MQRSGEGVLHRERWVQRPWHSSSPESVGSRKPGAWIRVQGEAAEQPEQDRPCYSSCHRKLLAGSEHAETGWTPVLKESF